MEEENTVCSRCGFGEVALVRKEMIGSGKYRKSWRCPRCSHTWETVTSDDATNTKRLK